MILPEQAPSRVRGGFRAFYSDEGGHPGIVAVVKARFPAPTAFLIPFTLAKARSDFEERVYLGPKRKTKPRGTRVRTVAKTTLHDLRHTFGTSAARHGIPLRTIMEWMGHEDIKTTMTYAHYSPAEREAAMIDRMIRRATDPGSLLDEDRTTIGPQSQVP